MCKWIIWLSAIYELCNDCKNDVIIEDDYIVKLLNDDVLYKSCYMLHLLHVAVVDH
jgi:hypothetical protein